MTLTDICIFKKFKKTYLIIKVIIFQTINNEIFLNLKICQ